MNGIEITLNTLLGLSLGCNKIQWRQLHESRRDPLTGLPTRALWDSLAERAIRKPGGLVVLLVDGDGIKAINDQHGHPDGDIVIQALGLRLQEWAGPSAVVGRLGGDEFGVLLRLHPAIDLEESLAALCEAVSVPVAGGDRVFQVSASVGAVRVEDLPVRDLYQARKAADIALYIAKKTCRGGWTIAGLRDAPFPVDPAPVHRVRHGGEAR